MLQLQIIGNIGRVPEVKTTNQGKEFITFSVAVNNRDKSTTWISMIANKQESLLPFLTKGKQVFAEGQMWVEMFNNQPVINMRAERIELCGKSTDGKEENNPDEIVVTTF